MDLTITLTIPRAIVDKLPDVYIGEDDKDTEAIITHFLGEELKQLLIKAIVGKVGKEVEAKQVEIRAVEATAIEDMKGGR